MGMILLIGLTGLLIGGIFGAARNVFLSLDNEEIETIKERGTGWAVRLSRLMEHPERFLIAGRITKELCFLVSGILLFSLSLERWGWTAAIITLAVFLLGFLWVGELILPTLVVRNPVRWAPLMTWIMTLVGWVYWPAFAMKRLASEGWRTKGKEESEVGTPLVSRQELSWIIRGREDDVGLLQEERKMIGRIFQFSETQVKEVMIPLIEVSAVEETATVGEVIRKVDSEGYSRFPVYRERIDRIYGIVHSFDFLATDSLDEPVVSFVRRAPYVPESMPVDDLLLQLQRQRNHMAIVVDEYGGSVGIVTLEDILEEIVGEIEDEHDIQRVLYRRLSPQQFMVSARMEIEELNEIFGLNLPKGEFETLGGFLLKEFRRIPSEGESLLFRGVRFTVRRADERRIYEVLLTLPKVDAS